MNKSIKKLREYISYEEGILLKSKIAKRYIKTLEGGDINVLITSKKIYLILDGRYIDDAQNRYSNNEEVVIIRNDAEGFKIDNIDIIKDICSKEEINNLKLEYNNISIEEYLKLIKMGLNISDFNNDFKKIRMIKDEGEVLFLSKACDIADKVFNELLDNIEIGMTEREINAILYYYAIKFGADRMSFEPVIASGKRTAFPHARPSDRKIEKNDFIMIDFGVEYKGYQSDMTRMIFIGEPNEKIKEIYNIVLEAQLKGCENILPGKLGKDVDKRVRDVIEKYGYGEYFIHGLGHGIGINNSDELPKLNQESNIVLENGMVMSCEPGIYIPGIGGVRIEDDILIINGKPISLNKTTKEMIILER